MTLRPQKKLFHRRKSFRFGMTGEWEMMTEFYILFLLKLHFLCRCHLVWLFWCLIQWHSDILKCDLSVQIRFRATVVVSITVFMHVFEVSHQKRSMEMPNLEKKNQFTNVFAVQKREMETHLLNKFLHAHQKKACDFALNLTNLQTDLVAQPVCHKSISV